jgi:PEP-CTERM motif
VLGVESMRANLPSVVSRVVRGALGLAAALLVGGTAQATTVNTYSFTQDGWYSPFPLDATLSGTFTGTVGSTGIMSLADLNAFSATLTITDLGGIVYVIPQNLTELDLFSFMTGGGASTLFFSPGGTSGTCVGAAATLVPVCNPQGMNPFGTVGDYIDRAHPVLFTSLAPVVTLVSSVTTSDSPTGVPEPAAWAMMILGLGAAGVALRRGRRLTAEIDCNL